MEERKAKLLIGIMYSDKKLLKKVLGLRRNKCIEFYHTFPDFRSKRVQDFILRHRLKA